MTPNMPQTTDTLREVKQKSGWLDQNLYPWLDEISSRCGLVLHTPRFQSGGEGGLMPEDHENEILLKRAASGIADAVSSKAIRSVLLSSLGAAPIDLKLSDRTSVIMLDGDKAGYAAFESLAPLAIRDRAVVLLRDPPAESILSIGGVLSAARYVSLAALGPEKFVLFVPSRDSEERKRLQTFVRSCPLWGGGALVMASLQEKSVGDPTDAKSSVQVSGRAEDVEGSAPPVSEQLPSDAETSLKALQQELSELRSQVGRVEQRVATQSELLRQEQRRLAAELRARADMQEARHDALLNGRVFGAIRAFTAPLRQLKRLGASRLVPSESRAGALQNQRGAEVAQPARPLESDSHKHAAQVQPAALAKTDESPLPSPASVRIAGVSYMSRKLGQVGGADVTYPGEPLISVIMTTFNTEGYVEAAVRSILDQTWKNLELIVVDDCSSDATREKVQALADRDNRIKLFCFGENNGTYFCKNFGITKARGSVVTFMDSDDISQPKRLEMQFEAVNKPGVAVSTCNHVRKDEAGSTILINGVAERVAYISQMVKRSVLDEVGYFDTVRTSADDEFLRRVRITYGQNAQVNVKEVLYIALLREGSLTRDPANAINFVQDRNASKSFLSPQRRHYAAMCDKWHAFLKERNLRPYMPFPVVRRPFPAFGRLVVGDNRYDGNQITACMATYPPREEKLRVVVEALLPQVDTICIYLNGYAVVPDFLRHSRIRTVIGEKDIRDNGKFHFMPSVPCGFCFTVDDDIAYPDDYVQAMIRKIEFYERKAIVGLHGTVYAKPIRSFFKGRTLLHFEEPLSNDVVVNQLGTGTVAFHTDLLRPDPSWFKETGMADVWLAVEARRRRIPLIAVSRGAQWLLPIGAEETTLFREFRKNDEFQTEVVRQLSPWREELSNELAVSVSGKSQRFGASYARLLPNLGVGGERVS